MTPMTSSQSRTSPVAVLALLAGIAFLPLQLWFVTLRPARTARLDAAETELSELDKHVEQARAAERKYPQFREEVTRLERERATLSRILPRENEGSYPASFPEPGTHAISGMTVHRGLVTADERWIEDRYEVRLAGTLAALTEYLTTFERQTRIVTIPRILLQREGDRWRATAFINFPYERRVGEIIAR
jgi:Tfp pilus assembly protein PilO